ncbi:hypothetical protein EMPS_05169 [Entomortierella parvispora]|uniref:Arylamine N-acetyltransferase n=1 Tax=Entomortierella parvispora TaxID=205924 RepID=A0A9P3HA33_9FUNG|nr:hypothetical protein EMPS_05169 [Entomortierella parvispora]
MVPVIKEEHFSQEQIFAILERIGYPFKHANVLPEPTLDTLRELHYRCVTSIPFELLSLRATKSRTVEIELDAIYDRVVNRRRGGWCFSLNKLAFELLRGLGFTTQYTLARMCKPRQPDDPISFRGLTHRVTIIRFAEDNNSKYVFDIGFGASSFYPLKLEEGFEVEFFGHRRRMVKAFHNLEEPHILGHSGEEYWQVQEFMGMEDKDKGGREKWTPCYAFTERQYYAIDCEINNYWSSCSPKSTFYGQFWVFQGTLDGKYNLLMNKSFKIRDSNGTVMSIDIETEDQRQNILKEFFGIEFTEAEWEHFDIKIE